MTAGSASPGGVFMQANLAGGPPHDEVHLWRASCEYHPRCEQSPLLLPPLTDPEKLRLLADWHDSYDLERGTRDPHEEPTTEVQADLRRIADGLEAAAGATLRVTFPAEALEAAQRELAVDVLRDLRTALLERRELARRSPIGHTPAAVKFRNGLQEAARILENHAANLGLELDPPEEEPFPTEAEVNALAEERYAGWVLGQRNPLMYTPWRRLESATSVKAGWLAAARAELLLKAEVNP